MRKLPPDYTAGQKFNVVTVSFDPKEHGDLATGSGKLLSQASQRRAKPRRNRILVSR